MQFGRDIVFTFGPLGYLIYGLPIVETYVWMLGASVAVALICAILGTALTATPGVPFAVRLVFVLALAVALPQASESLYLVTILAWMLPVFRARGQFPIAAAALGTFSAVIGLTEFKIAFVGFLGGALLFGGRAFLARRAREDANGAPSLVSFVSAYGLVYGFPFAWGDYGSAATLGIVALAAIALAVMLRPKFARSAVSKVTGLAGLMLALSFVLSPTCRAYIGKSAQLASGYSAGMSVVGQQLELNLALGALAIFTLLALIHLKRLTSPVAAAIALGAFGAFKEGFVRQDPPHVLFFFVVLAPMTAAVALLSSRRSQYLSLIACLIVFAIYDATFHNDKLGDVLAQSMNPASVAARAVAATQSISIWRISPEQFAAGLAGDVFPKDIQTDVGSQSANVLPWETAAIFANGFTWAPEPVFQSYAVLSSAADETNAAHLEKRGASRIFFEWAGLDGRYPLWDEPAASAVLLCRYGLAGKAPSIVTTQSGEPFLALKRSGDRCGSSVSSKPIHLTWGQSIPVPSGDGLTFARLSIRYNVMGSLTRTLFRVPGLSMTIDSELGQATFRIIRETSSDGILIDPLPEGLPEFSSLLTGFAGKIHRTRSFSIQTDAPYLYQSPIDVQFVTVAYRSR